MKSLLYILKVIILCGGLFPFLEGKAQSVILTINTNPNNAYNYSTGNYEIKICPGQTVTFTADAFTKGGSGTYTYQWRNGSGQLVGSGSTINVANLQNGNKIICQAYQSGQLVQTSSSYVIAYYSSNDITIYGPVTRCQGAGSDYYSTYNPAAFHSIESTGDLAYSFSGNSYRKGPNDILNKPGDMLNLFATTETWSTDKRGD